MTYGERLSPERYFPRLDSLEKRFLDATDRASNWQMELIRLQLSDGVKPEDLVLSPKPVRDMRDVLALSLAETASFGNRTALIDIAVARRMSPTFALEPDFTPDVGLDWYQEYALRIVSVEQVAVLDRAKAVIADSISRGLPYRDMVRELEGVFTGFSKARLQNIARTETAKIYEQARWQEFDSLEEVVGYQVRAIIDDRTSEICRSRNGKRIPKAAIEGWLPPYHWHCRTTVIPLFAWETVDYDDPDVGPKPVEGFGSTKMTIPDWRNRKAQSFGRRVRNSE